MKKNMIIALGVAAAAGLSATADTVYKNDFASRTSAEPVPRSDWFVKQYAPGTTPLSFGYDENKSYAANLPYSNAARIQDGWAKIVGNNKGKQAVNFWTRTDKDADNPFGCFSNQNNKYGEQYEIMAVQTLHNDFSNGVLRISADMRGPARNSSTFADGYFRVKPLFKGSENPGVTTYAGYALAFGMDGRNGTAVGKFQSVGSKGDKWPTPTTEGHSLITTPNRTHWYRFVADLYLETSKYDCRVYDLGTAQPTPDTATPASATGTVTGKYMYRRVQDKGPISGIGIDCKYMSAYSAVSSSSTTLAITNCPSIDNLRVWWKATDDTAAFGEDNLVYDNDFATRRFRYVQGSAASTETADALAVPASDSFQYWNSVATNEIVSAANLVVADSTGCDGWKVTSGGVPRAAVTTTDEPGGKMLAFPMKGEQTYTLVAQPIGKSITSGKIKLEGDLRLPDKWYKTTSRTFTLCLGTDELATTANEGYAVRAGIGSSNGGGDTDFHPYQYIDTTTGSRVVADVSLKPSTWYRVCVIADMESKAYDYSLYELGTKSGGFDRTVPDTPVYSGSGFGFYKVTDPSAITTFAIYAYASGADWKGAEIADNIRIATGTDGESWTTVYENNFSKRTRYGVRTTPEATLLNAEINRAGLDGWMRRGAYLGDWIVRNVGGNPCLAFEDESEIVHAQHLLPKPVERGKLTVRVDMRPPNRSTYNSAQAGRVFFGGDEYAQGEIGTYKAPLRNFTEAAGGNFGFVRAGDKNDIGYYSQVKLYVSDGTGDQSAYPISGDARNNWYRFKATFNMDEKTWRVDVYDQGTVQPTADAPNGTLVKSFENLTFKYEDPTGISAIGLAAGGSAGSNQIAADTKSLLVDNLVVEHSSFGLSIFVR